jgi:hypothetical protein
MEVNILAFIANALFAEEYHQNKGMCNCTHTCDDRN